MDIKSDAPYPSGALSNFTAHAFNFRGINCASMEGLLQSLKFENPEEQKNVCQLVGKDAKQAGLEKDWRSAQTLWWKGKSIPRDSAEYQEFLDEAYACLFSQNNAARMALLATGNEPLQHSIGLSDPAQTILTTEEFCSRLEKVRRLITPPASPSPPRRP